jgi:hypothetical protein
MVSERILDFKGSGIFVNGMAAGGSARSVIINNCIIFLPSR